MAQQSNTPAYTSFGQLLPSLNGFYDAQLDESFDLIEEPTVATNEKIRFKPGDHRIEASSTPAHYSFGQLLPSLQISDQDAFDAQFAAEEEELTAAGIIKPAKSTTDAQQEADASFIAREQHLTLRGLANQSTTPSHTIAAQVLYHSQATSPAFESFPELLTHMDSATSEDYETRFAAEEQELKLAGIIREAKTPAETVACQILWNEAREQARKANAKRSAGRCDSAVEANHSWGQMMPSLAGTA